MSNVVATENLETLRSLVRPLYEKGVFRDNRIVGFEDLHENIGLILAPCSTEQFHKTATQILRLFQWLQTADEHPDVSEAMKTMKLQV